MMMIIIVIVIVVVVIIIIIITAGPSGRAVYGDSPAEIVGSNPTGGMYVCLLCVVR